MRVELEHDLFLWVKFEPTLEPSVSASAVKMAPSGISHLAFHCINTCGVTMTETVPNCVEIRYKDSR